jgi:aldehyde dehydrogenase (NAD+)
MTGTTSGTERKPEAIPDLVARLRNHYDGGHTRPLEWRRTQLQAFLELLKGGEQELLQALRVDLGKPAIEAWATDLRLVGTEVEYMLKHLERWAKPERVKLPLAQLPGAARIVREPLGVVLVIAPWNYPVQLLLLPMAAAIAAGNAVIGKPSELAPNVSAAIARLVPQYLDERFVAIVEGGVPETTELLAERFDHIFYTGNGRVGRVVMEAAAKHLTPVTLELGGKSPVIVTDDADIKIAGRRIAWGKYLNAGQTCVAPDYVLVERGVETALVDSIRTAVREFYGDDPQASADYGRVVNDQHWRRLTGLLHSDGAGSIAVGGDSNESTRYVGPTVLQGTQSDAAIMQDEIFGPILPVIAVDSVDDAIDFVNERDKPLALYVFTGSAETEQRVIDHTSSGGMAVNHVAMQLAAPELPFGGVGPSGMGAYHGRRNFETFSHRKSVLTKPTKPDLKVAYPPFTRIKEAIIRRFL